MFLKNGLFRLIIGFAWSGFAVGSFLKMLFVLFVVVELDLVKEDVFVSKSSRFIVFLGVSLFKLGVIGTFLFKNGFVWILF